jgi:hypothetical protein
MNKHRSLKSHEGNCVGCGKLTNYCCADCMIDRVGKVYVCESPDCRNKHENTNKCSRTAKLHLTQEMI